ncbi:WD40 repeat domain-containing protein [Aspergillus clavatus NRRL 1]|uniref:Nuclear distribution protein nudF 2 n=1 Tax=Aspergillus clavatus (strain ATCC 1007 / CBS 513.65 / DSM 816 / NCTC 3887 / NRRL 1 / QM 1276 / 107) TaxID=344612 RepID=LIS12_ASPCL|nr:wd40 protein [Aspergillus clavatus NRRL 1]A1CF18.1 RecName: Full=Nuclear distribution protein nudF 2; AltName: Full=Lissencephaly-1 homolog 2; Short=LIS-1 2 [Aspergillus clavatus NRRL 1]EAW11467.1 wd40 protein [Aspergillus clavatus NRRL 1]
MARLLTNSQAEELHKSIIAYLSANGLPETTAILRKELGVTEHDFNATAVKKYETLLEKNGPLLFAYRESRDSKAWLPQRPRYSLHSHRDTINCIAFHPKYSSIASGSDDCTIKIWDWELGELEVTLKGHTRAVRDLDYGSPPGAVGVLLASCSSDLTIKLWDPADGYKNIRTLQGHDHIVSAVRFIPNGSLLASASRDMDVRLWDVTNGYCVKTIQGHTGWVRDVCASLDGRFILSTGDDMTVRLWDISAKPENKLTMVGHENFNECCAIAPPTSYQYLAPLARLAKVSRAGSTAEFMATGSRDKTIKLWDARGTCLMTLTGHDNWVRAIVFHPGGRYLLSVSDDKTLRCWDLSQEGKCVKTIRDTHGGFITCLRWAPAILKDTPTDAARALVRQIPDVAEIMKNATFEESFSDVQIRCVVATGSVDKKLQIFAG